MTYALVCLAVPRYLRDHGVYQAAPGYPALAFVAMLLALIGNLYPVPKARTASSRMSILRT